MQEKKRLDFQFPVLVYAGRVRLFYNLYFAAVVVFNGHQPAGLNGYSKGKLFAYNPCLIPCLCLLYGLFILAFSPYPREAWLGAPGYLSGFSPIFSLSCSFAFLFHCFTFPRKIDGLINIWLFSAAIIAILGLLEYLGLIFWLPLFRNLILSKGRARPQFRTPTIWDLHGHGLPVRCAAFYAKASCRTVPLLALIHGCLLTTLCRSAWLGAVAGFLLILLFYPAKKISFS